MTTNRRTSPLPVLPRTGYLHHGSGTLSSLSRTVSPPPTPKRRKTETEVPQKSAAAAVEAGEKHVANHLAFYSSHLLRFIRPGNVTTGAPHLSHEAWIELYRRNADSLTGCHFVIHQHDHPIAGTHYDLRLQCNPTSSISFAIMYGLPGNSNSRRLNRNAMETRVHCLWNHLIETASWTTGSMLLWDTGEYEVLPYEKNGEKQKEENYTTDEEDEDVRGDVAQSENPADETQQQKLKCAFQQRKMRLRLHGTRLPQGYTMSLRLTQDNFRSRQPKAPVRRRRRAVPATQRKVIYNTDSEEEIDARHPPPKRSLSSLSRLESPPHSPADDRSDPTTQTEDATAVASDNEEEIVRENNAYIGAINDIGSIHQRRWYLSMDRTGSGFVKRTIRSDAGFVDTVWVAMESDSPPSDENASHPRGFEKFIVGGRETERSIVTGRLASEILVDEGVIGYVPRGLWRPVTE